MKSITKIWMLSTVIMSSLMACKAQIKNQKMETVHIYGNCGMCKSAIEKAGNLKKVARVDWNADTQVAAIFYDSTKTNQEEILKRIALNGYDSEVFLAPNDAYNKLPECCQYERKAKPITKVEAKPTVDHAKMEMQEINTKPIQEVSQLKAVFENYFAIKDALVKTDGSNASVKAKELVLAINKVHADKLSPEEQTIWIKVMKELAIDAQHMADSKNISVQRNQFITLSKNMYSVMKATKPDTPIYFQHFLMANNGKGPNWLSKKNSLKNPYHGPQNLTFSKTLEI